MASPPAVVVITRNRGEELDATLTRLVALRESGEVADLVVVDNASTDDSVEVALRHKGVRVLQQPRNLGAAGRTVGAWATTTDLVAFADDDSWWEPGALTRAARCFEESPGLGLLHARVVVHPGGQDDDICRQLASGPREAGAPGPSIMGHLACAVVVRREAFLGVGGYSPVLGFGGEERLLSIDLAAAGWAQCYVEDVVAHHQPSPRREDWPERWARYRRNDTLTALLRLPPSRALAELRDFAADAVREPVVRREALALATRLPAVAVGRRAVTADVLARLDAAAEVPQDA